MDKRKFKYNSVHRLDPWHLATHVSNFLDRDFNLDLRSVIRSDADWEEELRAKVPENFCLLPFRQMTLDPDGRARPCCKYKVGDATWQENVPKLPDVSLEDLWHQKEFQELRSSFLRNQRPEGCRACWDEEAAGIKSMRLIHENAGRDHPFSTFFHHVPSQTPTTLDLKLSNLCNLKCRICTPFLSSQWVKEIKDLALSDTDIAPAHTFQQNSREKLTAREDSEPILRSWAPNLTWIEFYGGEPLMQQEHETILRILCESGQPEQTSLYYNTNGTICREEFFPLWAKFKQVVINFSIDDQGPRFEYQRKNAIWQDVLNNLKRYKSYSRQYTVNSELKIYTTIGILNVYYMPEFFAFMRSLNLPITLNLVHYPNHFAIKNLPDPVKHRIARRLDSIKHSDQIDTKSPDIENIINYMCNNDSDPRELARFFHKVQVHDQYRNENIQQTFPELWSLLKPYAA